MRYATVCSGIDAPSRAWRTLGWVPVFFSEVDRFCRAYLKHRHPGVPNFGDMEKHSGWPEASIDVLAGGTPCQAFALGGLREGMDDPRGNLTLTFLAVVEQYRPTWVVWENVPGVLSTNDGRDFGTFIGGLAQLGYGFAYRVLDAQYYGVPQRRRRVFVVGHLGDWRRAAAVLFDSACCRWDLAPRPPKEARVAGPLGGASQSGGFRTSDLENHGAFVIGFAEVADPLSANQSNTYTKEGNIFRMSNVVIEGDVPTTYDAATIPNRVRRLTPRECERLQGFPDDDTLVPYRGKLAADKPRYRALGNSIAVPVIRWIGERIEAVWR